MKIFFLLLLALNLIAQEDYSLRAAYGKATDSNLGDILIGNISPYKEDLSVVAFDGGYLLQEGAYNWPMDVYVKMGLSQFNESAVHRDDVYEAALYIKLYWNFDFWKNRIRFGLGEGGSYTSGTLFVEKEESESIEDGKTSYFLNYLDISLDFDLGRVIRYQPLYGTYIGWTLKHRSGIYGLINGVTKGGSNYNCLYLEKTF